MNKKYLQYIALILFFASINPSFAMDNNDQKSGYSWQAFAIGTVVVAMFPDLMGKVVASVVYEDVSPETQKWAIKVLEESGIKGADKIPFKKAQYEDQGWETLYDYFITIPEDFDPLKCDHQKCLEGEFILKHEVKHVQNYDGIKRWALTVGTIAAGLYLAKEKSLALVPFVLIGYVTNIAYCRYQESEADRFAHERATSREELIAAKNYFIQMPMKDEERFLQKREDDLLKLNLLRAANGIEEKEFQSKKDKIFAMIRNKDMLLYIGRVLSDRVHPSPKKRAAMAQDYIDKWDREHAQGAEQKA